MGKRLKAGFILGIGLGIISITLYHQRKPFSLTKVNLALGSANLSNEAIQEDLNRVIHYFESQEPSSQDRSKIANEVTTRPFLTKDDSSFIQKILTIREQNNPALKTSFFNDNKIKLYALILKLFNQIIYQRHLYPEQIAAYNELQELSKWIAGQFKDRLNNTFLLSQVEFYSQLPQEYLKAKLLQQSYYTKFEQLLYQNDRRCVEYFGPGFRLARKIGDKGSELDFLTRLQFVIYQTLGLTNIGLALGERLLGETTRIGYEIRKARQLYYNGDAFFNQGALRTAFKYFQLSRDLHSKYGYDAMLTILYERMGLTYRRLGQFDLALQTYEKMFQPGQKTKTSPSQIRYKLGLAAIYLEMSAYTKAESLLRQSLQLAQKLNKPQLEASALNHLGTLYDNLGDYPRALEFQQRALETLQANGNPSQIADLLSRLTVTYSNNYELEKATMAGANAFDYISKFDFGQIKARALKNLGSLQLQIGDLKGSLESLNQAWLIFKDIESFDNEIETLNLLSETQRRTGNYDIALESLNKVMELSEDLPKFPYQSDTYLNFARVYKDLNQRGKAEEYLKIAISSVKRTDSDLANNEQRYNFSQKIHPIFEEMVLLQLAKNNPELAFFHAEEERAQVLKILLQSHSEETPKHFDAAIAAQPPQDRENYLQKIRDLQNVLNDSTVLVEYEVTDSLLVSWVISRHHFEAKPVKVSRKSLEKLISEFRAYNRPDSLETSRLFKRSFQETEALGQRFYNYLIAPISDYISDAKRVYFVPDETLNYLPFAAIKTPEGNYLIQNFAITLAQSADIFKDSFKKERFAYEATDRFLAVAANEDLAYSKSEVETVGKLNPHTKTLLGAKITEKVIREAFRDAPFRLILLATHGKLNEKKPYFSGLLLNKELSGTSIPENNGFLTVQEIQELALEGTDLVYLSACESASGRLYRGEGIVGMQRAFLIAGANSVIANLWQVDDKAAKNLTVEFFEKWSSGKYTKAEALRLAQLSQISQLRKSALFNKHAHPYFWAAVTLTGSPD